MAILANNGFQAPGVAFCAPAKILFALLENCLGLALRQRAACLGATEPALRNRIKRRMPLLAIDDGKRDYSHPLFAL